MADEQKRKKKNDNGFFAAVGSIIERLRAARSGQRGPGTVASSVRQERELEEQERRSRERSGGGRRRTTLQRGRSLLQRDR